PASARGTSPRTTANATARPPVRAPASTLRASSLASVARIPSAARARREHSGRARQGVDHPRTTDAFAGRLCFARAFGSQISLATWSTTAIPATSISARHFWVVVGGHERSSASPSTPTARRPGSGVQRGPVSRYCHRVWAFGFGADRDRNLSSVHILRVTLL